MKDYIVKYCDSIGELRIKKCNEVQLEFMRKEEKRSIICLYNVKEIFK